MSSSGFVTLLVTIALTITNTDALCGRTNDQGKKSCRGENYTSIPFDELQIENFTILDLAYTSINILDTRGFATMHNREYIIRIDMDSTPLSAIPRNAFAELNGLKELDLSNCNFSYIGRELCHITTLEMLNLDNNPIIEINPNAFKCLKNLKILSMNNIHLTKIPVNLINGTNIQTLDLQSNYITNINDLYVPKGTKVNYSPRNGGIPDTELATTANTIRTTASTIVAGISIMEPRPNTTTTTPTTNVNKDTKKNVARISTINDTTTSTSVKNDGEPPENTIEESATQGGSGTAIIIIGIITLIIAVGVIIIILCYKYSQAFNKICAKIQHRALNVNDPEVEDEMRSFRAYPV